MLQNAQPKPTPRAKAKAARARLVARAHRRVYAEVTERDGGRCRVCTSRDDLHRHHLRGRKFTTTADVCLLCWRCHAELHVRVGGVQMRLHGDADCALTVERRPGGTWVFWRWV